MMIGTVEKNSCTMNVNILCKHSINKQVQFFALRETMKYFFYKKNSYELMTQYCTILELALIFEEKTFQFSIFKKIIDFGLTAFVFFALIIHFLSLTPFICLIPFSFE